MSLSWSRLYNFTKIPAWMHVLIVPNATTDSINCFPLFAYFSISRIFQGTVLMALLQPAPEVYDLFDDIMLLCEGKFSNFSLFLPHINALLSQSFLHKWNTFVCGVKVFPFLLLLIILWGDNSCESSALGFYLEVWGELECKLEKWNLFLKL